MSRAPLDKSGQRYGKLLVVSMTDERVGSNVVWKCRCDCGNVIKLPSGVLRPKSTRRCCGCSLEELRKQPRGGFTTQHRPEYRVWKAMMARCYNEKDEYYEIYGERGIKVCKRWHEFKNFVSDMAPRPEGKQLDRKNNDKGYSPKNCRWVTPKENSNNRSNNILIKYKGVTKTLSQWSEHLGFERATLERRINKYGWSVKKAFTRPVQIHRKQAVNKAQ